MAGSVCPDQPDLRPRERAPALTRRLRTLLLALAAGLLLAGCPPTDDDDSGGGDDDDSWEERAVTLAGPCDRDALAGRFRVERQELFPVVDGAVADGVVPVTILEELDEIGPCRLLRRTNPFCNPACSPGFTCDFDGECVPFPENQNVGTVEVRGLSVMVSMEPVQPGNRYFDTTVGDPLFEPGAEVFLDASGADLPAFALEGVGSEVLELPDVATILIEEGQPTLVQWPAPLEDGPATVHLELSIDQHGNSPVRIECELDDTGSAELPPGVADALLAAGVSGYPNATLSRRTVDSAPVGDFCVELLVGSPRTPDVRVAGHTPCDEPDDCPEGLTCDLALNTCL